ncbi:hypothetical protein ARALYDRAFT_898203 [Arabidopsis lyrata subsp. lyrata]|uniref:Uncharacterized protein n=1 Tax=Arabidopsis lyrata subsp. lyrata TaxID=81972 RepID=D7L8H3_ARALL|nr:hypothetical protein ARALYDRAFT_898203 [Arabidopsis lyrata subsp. lyrata]
MHAGALVHLGLGVTCLLCYCSEGDNISEAFLLAEAVSKLTGQVPWGRRWEMADTVFVEEYVMYGAPPDMSMF